VNYADSTRETYYLDPDSFQERKILHTYTSDGKTVTRELIPSDFRSIEGVLFAFRVVEIGEDKQRSEVQLESVTLNPGLLEALFRQPPDKK